MSWQTLKLGEVCHFVRGPFGGALKKEYFVPDGYAVYEQQHAIYDQFENIRYFVDANKFNEMKRFALKEGDLIMSCSGTMGKVAIVPANIKKGIINQALLKLTPNKDLDLRFLKLYMESEAFQFELNENTHGAAIKNVASVSILKDIKIPLPHLPEQKRIAAILDKADEIRRKRETAIAKLDKLAQSIFVEMFGDAVENTKNWTIIKLGNCVEKIGSGATPTGGDAAYKDSGISLIRSLNVHDGEFRIKNLAFIDDLQASKLVNVEVKDGDVLLNITGASVARVCRVPKFVLPARVNQHVMIIRPNKSLSNVFLERFLLNEQVKRKLLAIGGSGATREAITKAQAQDLAVINPPSALQEEFASRIKKIEQLKAKNITALAKQNNLFASLQHQAFNGQL